MSDVVLTFFCPVTKGKVEWDTPHDAKITCGTLVQDHSPLLLPLQRRAHIFL